MQLLLALSALAVAVSASPIGSVLEPRAVCAALVPTTTTLGGKTGTYTGPFHIQGISTATALSGKYARSAANTFSNIFFNAATAGAGEQFYLDSSSHLVSVQGSTLYTAYAYNFNGAPYLAIGPTKHTPLSPAVTCSINSLSCAIDCTQGKNTINYLASPKYEPDWSLEPKPLPSKSTAKRFQPYAVPG